MIYQNKIMRIVPFERDKHFNETYYSWFHDADVTRYNSHGLFPYTAAAREEFMRTIEQGSTSKIIWAIEVLNPEYDNWKKSSTLCNPPEGWIHIGNVSLQSINWINRSAELAIVLGQHRGKGYGLQACQWVMEHAFEKLNLHRVWTGTASVNIAMRKICEKLVMTNEGVFRDGMFLDGKYTDIMTFARLSNDLKITE